MKTLHTFESNKHGRDFVVGDIHGMYTDLMNKLSLLNFDKSCDRLFAVGDLIDRGPESEKCMELPYEPWFFSVRGNHEDMMFDVIVKNKSDDGMWFSNGGSWWYGCDQSTVQSIADDLSNRLPYGIEIETKSGRRVGIVHADVYFSIWRKNFDEFDLRTKLELLWSRKRINRKFGHDVIGIDRLYVGHTPRKGKEIVNNVHYIDCGGCFTSGYLHIEEIV